MDEHIWVVEKWDLGLIELDDPSTWRWDPVSVRTTRKAAREDLPDHRFQMRYRVRKYVPVEEE